MFLALVSCCLATLASTFSTCSLCPVTPLWRRRASEEAAAWLKLVYPNEAIATRNE